MTVTWQVRLAQSLTDAQFQAAGNALSASLQAAGLNVVEVTQVGSGLNAVVDTGPAVIASGAAGAITRGATFLANTLRTLWNTIPPGAPRTIAAALGLAGIAFGAHEVIIGAERIILNAQTQRRLETILNDDTLSPEAKRQALEGAIALAQEQQPVSLLDQFKQVAIIGGLLVGGVLVLQYVLAKDAAKKPAKSEAAS